jgi:hypothetical protein
VQPKLFYPLQDFLHPASVAGLNKQRGNASKLVATGGRQAISRARLGSVPGNLEKNDNLQPENNEHD